MDTNAVVATNFTIQSDATVSFSGPARERTTLTLPLSNQWLAAIRLEVVPAEAADEKKKSAKKPKRNPSDIALSATLTADGQGTKLVFHHAEADSREPRYVMGLPIIGVKDLWKLSADHELQTAVWLLDKPIQIATNAMLAIGISLFEFRWFLPTFRWKAPLTQRRRG